MSKWRVGLPRLLVTCCETDHDVLNPGPASKKINPSTFQLEFEGLLRVDPELCRMDQGVR
jgi:hypothetical protein